MKNTEDSSADSSSCSQRDANELTGLTEHSDRTGEMHTPRGERDEVKEIQKIGRKDTFRVQMLRLAVTGALLATAITVTIVTYQKLRSAEQHNFETAFEQFARTVGASAVSQQQKIVHSYQQLADTMSSAARAMNATWPFFILPRFEQYAHHTLTLSDTETLSIEYNLKNSERKKWIELINERVVPMVAEGYKIASKRDGPQIYDNFKPFGYSPFIGGIVGFDTKTNLPIYGEDIERENYTVLLNFSPPPMSYSAINFNVGEVSFVRPPLKAVEQLKRYFVYAPVAPLTTIGSLLTEQQHAAMHTRLQNSSVHHPHSLFYHPVHADSDDYGSEIVAVIVGTLAWDAALQKLLPDSVKGVFVVVENNCNQTYTYEVQGGDALFVGEGDLHDAKYDSMGVVYDLAQTQDPEYKRVPGHCIYRLHVYPSSTFKKSYATDTPTVFAAIVASTFLFVIVVFFMYDMFVQRRNNNLVERAARSNAIVSSVFPDAFRDKLLGDNAQSLTNRKSGNLKTFMTHGGQREASLRYLGSKPLADLFLETTVMFADIVGFTAWSSVREPTQVFMLLESLYSAFDEIACTRRVFKVETVGDCYVAATGMPEPRKDHAAVMCRFARDIMNRMHAMVRTLEVTLGPDTAELDLRIGIHSGPVTAGILRGERARFQLFGDTMNMTARIESTGEPGRIHLSQESADALSKITKDSWVVKRSDIVHAKGKGEVQTYWLVSSFNERKSSKTEESSQEGTNRGADELIVEADSDAEKLARRIDWLVECFTSLLKQIIARRNARQEVSVGVADFSLLSIQPDCDVFPKCPSFLDEVKEIIELPEFDSEVVKRQQNPNKVEIGANVVEQLRDYVTCISSMYQDNDFHNFEHATHVTMAVLKLLSRIVAPSDLEMRESVDADAATLHDYTYGITSDPLTQFACAFSSLIHDVDHSGVPNTQLIKEEATVAAVYGNRSVAEQNSLTLAWDLLMDPRFAAFRTAIYSDNGEQRRFYQLVINSVMATDIVDKELKNLRNARWDVAFAESSCSEKSRDVVNRKATIFIEHLIQAADVSHTMQHWHIYRKWNERFFRECYKAYKDGRAETDPSLNWYKGEIGFFDFYIIPLTKKLKDCGVFGKSSDEYLNYAIKNRQEWEVRGEEVVAEMVEAMNKMRV